MNKLSMHTTCTFILCTFLFLLFPFNSGGQEKDTDEEQQSSNGKTGGFGYFAMSGTQFNISNLNTVLQRNNYPTFQNRDVSFGGGGFIILNNILIGGEGHGSREQSVASKNYELTFSSGSGSFNLGYMLWSTKDIFLYPYIRLGGGTVDLTITNKNKKLNFTGIMQQPGQSSHLSKQSYFITPCLGFSYKPLQGLHLGLQVGYNYVYTDRPWQLDNVTLNNYPTANVGGPFIRLILGGGGF